MCMGSWMHSSQLWGAITKFVWLVLPVYSHALESSLSYICSDINEYLGDCIFTYVAKYAKGVNIYHCN